MDITIVDQKEIPLLSRKVIKAHASFTGAVPSGAEIKAGLAKALKAKEDLIVVNKIDNRYGSKKAEVTAYQYMNADDMKLFGQREKKKTEKPAKEKKEAPAAKEAPAEKKEAAEKSE